MQIAVLWLVVTVTGIMVAYVSHLCREKYAELASMENESNQPTSGSATFNVSPSPFGVYLNKIGCFCFEKQTLKPGEKREFILTFFLDPKVVDDNKTKNVADVTLSFTFFSTDYYKKDKV
mgnify:CR=1 FL=1